MSARLGKIDRRFLIISTILIVAGYAVFSSASLALLAKESSNYSNIAFSQTVFGLFMGTIGMIALSRFDFRKLRKYAFWLLLLAIILNVLVLFVGFEHAGAKRWIAVGKVSFQTSEVLKFAFIIYFAAWAASIKGKISTFKYGFLPLAVLLGISAALLLSQPDTDNFLLIVVSGLAMFLSAGGKWRYIFIIGAIGLVGLAGLVFMRPYLKERVMTYIDPSADSLGASYQVQQSLIAVGSGGVFGRGFGQSVQKYTYLPEPIGDSVFAVAAEEFGFAGSVAVIMLFALFAARGLKIASETKDIFGRLVVVGIVIMIVSQAFVNIGAMLGVLPLSGITLPFFSHGGTSLLVTLFEVGIVMSISRSRS